MFDNAEEDKDLASQVSKDSSSGSSTDERTHENIGSPITPEKLDPKMDLDQKTSSADSAEKKSEQSEKTDKTEKSA